MKTQREIHLYDHDGIKVTLVNVPIHRCPECGDFEVEIQRIEEMTRVLVDTLIRKASRLASAEIRFLRKSLGWSSADFARHIGVDQATVSRWETGKQNMGSVAERFFRFLVSVSTPIEDYTLNDLDVLSANSMDDAPPLRFKNSSSGWTRVAA